MLKIVKKSKKSREDIRTVGQFVRERGGIAYARERMQTLAAEAAESLAEFPPTEARDALLDLAAFIVARKR
jgi:octaprenyl-diphosphate synthase